MSRTPALLALTVLASACGGSDFETGRPPADEAYYEAALKEGLANAQDRLGDGLPGTTKYCVAITGGYGEPEWQGARAPDEELLLRLNDSEGPATFHAFSDCSVDYPATAPDGDRAAPLWVEPLETGGEEFMVGWIGLRDSAGWGCRLHESEGGVTVAECSEWWES